MPYKHPFKKESADVILRSSDGDDFRVHKLMLSEASSVFEGMFSLPQPADASSEHTPKDKDTPVVEIPENSRTLDHLLRFCYPMSQPALESLQEVIALLEAMKKYEMDDVARDVREALLDGRFSETAEDAFTVYSAVWRLDFKDDLVNSARATFLFKLPSFESPVIQSIPPAAIFALMEFRGRCVGAAMQLLFYPDDWQQFQVERWEGTEHADYRSMTLEKINEDTSALGNFVHYACRSCVWGSGQYPWHRYVLHVDREDARNEFISILRERPCGQALQTSVCLRSQVCDDDNYGDRRCAQCVADGLRTVAEVLDHLCKNLDEKLAVVPFDASEPGYMWDPESDLLYRQYI